MSKYIDADLLKAEFTGNFRDAYETALVKAIIDDQPTAYDIDKVVEQLEEKYTITWKSDYEGGYKDGIIDAIKIVKGGVK